jgi:hypothetical protein
MRTKVDIEEVARRLDAKSESCLKDADELQAELTAKGVAEPVLHPSVVLKAAGADAYRVAAEMCRGEF